MRCRGFEKLIVEALGQDLPPEDEMRLADHLRVCAACARFRADIAKIMDSGEAVRLPADLDRRTKEAWLASFKRPVITAAEARSAPGRAVPMWLNIVLVLLAFLTTAWVVPLFDLSATGEKVPWEAGAAVLILIQNGLALFLSPVLLRRAAARGRRGSLSPTKTSA
jgi:hypothetical protein